MKGESVAKTTGAITLKEKLGYAMGEFAQTSVFALVGFVLQKYYTDILHIELGTIIIMFTVARIWDGINDPLWGLFIDSRKPVASGRYKRWILIFSVPVAISAFLMFVNIPYERGGALTVVIMYATYILFGMMYTTTNIAYGSLSSVMTNDEATQVSLATFRSAGGTFGGVPAMTLASFAVVTLADGTKKLNQNIVLIGVAAIGLICVLGYTICYRSVQERIVHEYRPRARGTTGRIIRTLIADRAFMSLSFVGLLLLATGMFTQSYYLYLFNDYFKSNKYFLFTFFSYVPMLAVLPFIGKIVKKVGKREICGFGMLFSGAVQLLAFALHTSSDWLFIALNFLSGFGVVFFTMQVWAMVNDVIDNLEVRTGQREEATTYSFFMFSRKLGQTVAGILSPLALIWIHYVVGSTAQQSAGTLANMYNMATLIPAAMYLLIALFLLTVYPLSRKEMAALQQKKQAIRGSIK